MCGGHCDFGSTNVIGPCRMGSDLREVTGGEVGRPCAIARADSSRTRILDTITHLGPLAFPCSVRVRQLLTANSYDSVTFGSVAVLLIVIALVACSVPARRATRIDPMATLRAE